MFEVDAAGSAGMLIRRSVLRAMDPGPWFESSNGVVLNEDVHFCIKARANGHRIFATSDVTMGHIGIFNVRPVKRDSGWGSMVEFTSADERLREVFMPDLDHEREMAL